MSAEIITFYDSPKAKVYAWIFFRRCYVHVDVRESCYGVFRFLLEHWPEIPRIMKAVGVRNIYAFAEDQSDQKWARFVSRLGFKPLRMAAGRMIYEYSGDPS